MEWSPREGFGFPVVDSVGFSRSVRDFWQEIGKAKL